MNKRGICTLLNPYLTNGFSHHCQWDESTFIFRGVRRDFYFLSHFSMKFLCANRIAPDGTSHSVAHKMTTRLIRVKMALNC